MKPIYLNLDQTLAEYVATLKVGDEWCYIKPIDYQPTPELTDVNVDNNGDYITFHYYDTFLSSHDKLTYPLYSPIGSIMLGREAWCRMVDYRFLSGGWNYYYKVDNLAINPTVWRSAQCMSRNAIRHKFEVIKNKVKLIIDIATDPDLVCLAGFKYKEKLNDANLNQMQDWFNKIYGKGSWENNVWCEVATMRKVK